MHFAPTRCKVMLLDIRSLNTLFFGFQCHSRSTLRNIKRSFMWKKLSWVFHEIIRIPAAHASKKVAKKQALRDSIVHDLAVDTHWKGNRAYVFGLAATGALGIENLIVPQGGSWSPKWGLHYPARLSDLEDPVMAACGYGFTMYICGDSRRRRTLYGCGINSDGQLGQNFGLKSETPDSKPLHVVPAPQLIVLPLSKSESEHLSLAHIACGRAHSVVGLEPQAEQDGRIRGRPILFTMGNNAFGQCGRQIVQGELYGPGTAVTSRISLPPEVLGLKQICCGQDHTLLLSIDGVVYAAGLGTDGQTGLGHLNCTDQFQAVGGALRKVHITQLSSVGDTVLALSECGRLFAWGNNEYGQIWPAGDALQVPEPVELPLDECVVPEEAGANFRGVRIGKVLSVAAAGSMCSLVDDAGFLFVWGFGCIGLGPQTNFAHRPTLIPPGLFVPAIPKSPQALVSVTAGLHHFIARNANGLLWAWGAPRSGLYCLGLGVELSKKSSRQTYPFPVKIPAEVKHVLCGVDHSVVLAKSLA
ncbi:RCC1-like G exchanging factor-like protein [Clonorchis sinensis]|uniref:RCC1-like G exchanging factor-like protein n=1 Tax=Clonorchis sinensis TaxID=79923 RepID=A0A8T1MHG6_CLOSI|nr:RCC1-like G exchanging factor-like protein [Clonorchis sinensis]